MAALAGQCLCGAVEVELAAPPVAVALCHCADCRRAGGTAFSVVGFVAEAAVTVRGTPASYADRADAGGAVERRFCGTCGSPVETVAAAMAGSGLRLVKLGLFAPDSYPPPDTEVFCGSRAAWLPPLPGTATFDRMPPAGGDRSTPPAGGKEQP